MRTATPAANSNTEWGQASRPVDPSLPRRLDLRRGQVSDDHVLLHLVDYDLVGLPRLAGIELNRLVDVLVLLFGQLVVRHHFHGVLVLLWIGPLKQQGDIADALPVLGFAQLELEVVPFAQALQRLQFGNLVRFTATTWTGSGHIGRHIGAKKAPGAWSTRSR